MKTKMSSDSDSSRRTIGGPSTSTGKGNVAQEGGFCDGKPRSAPKGKDGK